jgi:hypothetical protein
MKDLVILVADKNMEFAVKGILSRPQALSKSLLICLCIPKMILAVLMMDTIFCELL